MKLNPDCIREVLIKTEDIKLNGDLSFNDLCEAIPDFTPDEITYTCLKLKEAGYLIAMTYGANNNFSVPVVFDLTYTGHEFLQDIRSSKTWKTVKTTAGKIGSFSLKTLSQIAAGIIQAMITQQLSGSPPTP